MVVAIRLRGRFGKQKINKGMTCIVWEPRAGDIIETSLGWWKGEGRLLLPSDFFVADWPPSQARRIGCLGTR